MDEEQRRRMAEADAIARGFSFVNAPVSSFAAPLAGAAFNAASTVVRATNPLANVVPAIQAARTAVSGTPLIGGRNEIAQPQPTVPAFPSGGVGGTMAPSRPTQFPFGSALGPSIPPTINPSSINLRTNIASPVPIGQSFAGINPQSSANYIPFSGGGTATMRLDGTNVQYPSRLGLMGGTIASGSIAPTPVPQSTEMLRQSFSNPFATQAQRFGPTLTQGLTPIAQSNTLPVGGGPVSMNITSPQTAEQQGRRAIQTPYGTVYATQEQAANMTAPRTLAQQGSRSPAEQQALLAQMRERGSAIGQRIASTARQSFEQRQRPETFTTPIGRQIAAPTNMFGQPIEDFRQIYSERNTSRFL